MKFRLLAEEAEDIWLPELELINNSFATNSILLVKQVFYPLTQHPIDYDTRFTNHRSSELFMNEYQEWLNLSTQSTPSSYLCRNYARLK